MGAAGLLQACGGRSSTPTPTTSVIGPEPPICSGPHGGSFWNTSSTANLDPGYYAYTRRLEAELGRRFAGVRKNYWPGPGEPQVSAEIAAAYAAGRRWTYMNGKPDPRPTDGAVMRWRTVAAGGYDGDLARFFHAIAADARWTSANPFHFSFHHEQYVTAEEGGALAGTPEEYVAAFRHVRDVMDAAGAHVSRGGNMLMCWTPQWLQIARDGDPSWPGYPYDASHCDPAGGGGPPPYDLLGADVYLREGASFTADDMWSPVHEWALRRGVAFFAGEAGLAWTPGAEDGIVHYLDDLERLLDGWGAGSEPGRCLAVCWTSRQARGGDYRLDADPTVLASYRRLGASRLFAGCVV